uniref:Uncharacterized protein n=1 Tax=Corethron hystrix TaxID=216773 RepID=A0A7S1BK61_9STRA|mmetsp:Transcript_28801/g.65901  ORF Transcript_28801/g.65901 Transcript_28801/m.65901 type:complete len:103 (+) Transcript_28801:309-617(+)
MMMELMDLRLLSGEVLVESDGDLLMDVGRMESTEQLLLEREEMLMLRSSSSRGGDEEEQQQREQQRQRSQRRRTRLLRRGLPPPRPAADVDRVSSVPSDASS